MHANTRASLLMVLAMAGFTFNDSLIKGLDASISVAQVLLVRGVMISLILALFLHRTGERLHSDMFNSRLLWIRSLMDVGATFVFVTALRHLPLAAISAVLQAIPLAVTAAAAIFLGETVGWRRYLAIVIGFIGVLLVIRPGSAGFSLWSVLPFLVVLFATVRDLLTRRLPSRVPSIAISLSNAVSVTLAGFVALWPSGGWVSLDGTAWLTLAGAALCLSFGYHGIVLAMREGDVSIVAPFRYTALLWAVAIGWAFYAEVPSTLTLIGSVIIVGSGVYSFYRERRLRHRSSRT